MCSATAFAQDDSRIAAGLTQMDLRSVTVAGVRPDLPDAGDLTIGYYHNDAVRSITQGQSHTEYLLDPLGRRRSSTGQDANHQWATTMHYTGGSDNPAWTSGYYDGVATKTWCSGSIGGDIGLIDTNGEVKLTLTDLHGDVVTTVDLPADGEDAAGFNGYTRFDEYGNLATIDVDEYGEQTLSVKPDTGVIPYGYPGAARRGSGRCLPFSVMPNWGYLFNLQYFEAFGQYPCG